MLPGPAAAGRAPSGLARRALLVLTLVNLVNYLDRYVVAALVESLKRSELAPTDTELGALQTAFLLVYMVASPVFGALADRGVSRPRLLAAGVAVWSVATLLSAFATSYAALFLARAAVGIGEAAYGTVAPAMIADQYPRERRGRAFAIFYCAIPIGSALGYVVGGAVDHLAGWRAAFMVAAAPGLLLSLAALRLPDPERGAMDDIAPAVAAGARGAYRRLVRNVPYVLTVLGYAAYTFAIGGMAFWMPAFLERARGVPRAEATVLFGGIVVATGFLGTFAGGWLGDKLVRRWRNAYLGLSGLATLAAAPLAVLVFASPSRPVWLGALVLAELLLFASTGPVNSVIVNVVAPGERASAVALSIFAIHALGDVPSPSLIGRISDATSLATGVLVVPVAIALSGAIWTFAALRAPD
jgi:MFS transporter, Spinster family, sphingosine-1-phosphate transporter